MIVVACPVSGLSIGIRQNSISVSGFALGVVAVVMFSGTVPATRIAVGSIDPVVVGVGRSVLGALIAAGYLVVVRASWPARSQLPGLFVVALGAAVGFGWFSAEALRTVSASHGSVVIGILPMLTAVFGTLRTAARPRPLFWLATVAGTGVVITYAASGSRSGSIGIGDVYLFCALVCAAAAYAEGGRLARTMPGGQVIAWGLVAALPISVPLTAIALHNSPFEPTAASLAAVAYMAVFSVFVGMVLWYRAMGLVGVPRVSPIQLGQPLLSVVWSWLLIGEPLRAETIGAAVLVLVCVATAQKARISQSRPAIRNASVAVRTSHN
ncbi:MAG TPA: DMT family transporter [Candidatus Dormibacteraeota bacterium]|nr:DMT family transporter [Candidatus Dormibacteraeota bacterium]